MKLTRRLVLVIMFGILSLVICQKEVSAAKNIIWDAFISDLTLQIPEFSKVKEGEVEEAAAAYLKKANSYERKVYSPKAEKVYAPPESREFHLLNCAGLGNLDKSELLEFNSANEAENAGGTPDPGCIF